ncbi:bifunctional GTP diphosphokinase/guanosine-3',5'-bis pyrophosphate 3'-pyrophosphohydrolase [Marinobacter nanhaiticus D15-8W]|uniref:guanosine-3',5'-bis(diphosphate) 3'-diphosphatase n=1 Tax=Marinobacter nanhaiticus D15-8W TaxID=626887 RepID=N6W3E4_9GAMM|nr:RelA/SpoT family protein [Marinobacter nanhaiticus D15-8W]BES69685.1 bifunctional GTP diphosphokinase/guanosine-3',5'-bis pyrophosphate 3'-pyrophosphohydrolase [Marinobacter nanhaiticus D15-8W]
MSAEATAISSVDTLAEQLSTYLDTPRINQVRRAYYYAEQAHEGQMRRSGEPYITHPLAVARILADMKLDHQSLMAAMLHDVIEDTGIPKDALSEQFGEPVADLVDGVSKLTQIEFRSRAEAQAENFQKMTLAMARDIRVILVKLADRLHNMRTLGHMSYEKRQRIATETLDIYAPIANRLGMHSLCTELEDLGFSFLYPMRSRYISKAVEKLRGSHREIIEEIRGKLEEKLNERGLPGRIIGREKHLNSIYNKMKFKHKSFHEIMDVYAFRIITDTTDDCYRILGAVHSLYKPLPGRFKDYIAMPKANGYQSLHTTLFGMHVNIEIQIRTEEMEQIANNGIAAHWLYKNDNSAVLEVSQRRVDRWVQGLMEMRERADDSLEFIEHVKVDLFPDEIYVFTPKGKILELPGGATPIDFAYAIHTDIGNACVACRINRNLGSLSQPLQSGQTVEVITAPGARPNPAWLSFVVTGKARSSIRHFLKYQKKAESLELGKTLLKKSLAGFDYTLSQIDEAQRQRVCDHNQAASFDDLLSDIGLGNRMAYIVARQLVSDPGGDSGGSERPDDRGIVNIEAGGHGRGSMTIRGTEGLLVRFASCCKPIPGDPVVGVMESGSGMVIHSDTCRKLPDKDADRSALTPLKWAKDITDEFSVELRVELERQRGVIAEVASAISLADGNIERINVEEQNARLSIVSLVVHVNGRRHLARVMRRVRNVRAVTHIARVRH